MVSDDSDDEPLSALVEAKKLNPAAFVTTTLGSEAPKKKKRKRCKRLPVTIDLVPALKNLMAPQVIQRPEDVWLYLKDLNPAGPYTCLLCPDWFINRSKVIVHYILNHKKDFCGICRYFVADRETWLTHLTFHSPWTCSQCPESYETESDLREHFKLEHKMVYCRLCHFLVSDNEQYVEHLSEKHSVTNPTSIEAEFFWELDSDGRPKFDCILCQKKDISCSNYFNHYFCYHRFTLKSFTSMISGKEIPFSIAGIKISPNFVETQLKDQKKCGYVDSDWKPEKESEKVNENSEILSILIPEVKQEIVSDNEEDPFAQCSETPEENVLPENLKSYKGEVDFDITQTELIILQKGSQDYINGLLENLSDNIIPEFSEIDYKQRQSFNCSVCMNEHDTAENFCTHMNKMHGVKMMPLYSCRVCLNSFESVQMLTAHSLDEMGDFQDLWICQFCDKEFDNREQTRRHLTEHFSAMDFDNCFSPHLGFKCRYCPTLFWNEPEREMHQVKVHFSDNKEDYIKCDVCAEVFSDRVFFAHHYIEAHGPAEWVLKCNMCSLSVRDVDSARAHFRELHCNARKIFCDISPCRFRPLAHRGTLKSHMKSAHSREMSWSCGVCARVFPSARARGAHAVAAHARAGFRCKLCGDSLFTSDERKLHYLLRHPGKHPYQCGICPRSFPYKSSLYAHRAEHTGASVSFTCSYCGKIFLKKDSYREHLAIHAGPRHACSYCPQRFVQRSNMLRHERRHTGERPYACGHCPRTFSDRGAANSHARTHSKDQSFKCLYCGQTFAQKSKLTYHTRKHTGENLETCQVCGKLFTSACSLREHMKIHNSRFSVPCPLCDRKYHDERTMIRHIRSAHGAGAARHDCPLCSRTFTDSTALRHHVPTHAERHMFRCKYCPKTYAVKRSMVSHLQRRHQLGVDLAGAAAHYVHLDVRDCGLKLDEETILKIFGPRRSESDIALTEHVVVAEPPNINIAQVTVKMENTSDAELEPTDFVSVKIEPADDESMSE